TANTKKETGGLFTQQAQAKSGDPCGLPSKAPMEGARKKDTTAVKEGARKKDTTALKPVKTWPNPNRRSVVRIRIPVRIRIRIGHRESDTDANRNACLSTWCRSKRESP